MRVTLWAPRNRCTVLSPTVIPHEAASALRISCRVKSGCRATNCSTLALCSLNRQRRSPPIARGRAWPSARQRGAQRVALLTLTSNRVAAARALPPSARKPITRSLKSCEYGAGISPPMASSNLSLANQQGPENPSLYVSTWSEIALAAIRTDNATTRDFGFNIVASLQFFSRKRYSLPTGLAEDHGGTAVPASPTARPHVPFNDRAARARLIVHELFPENTSWPAV